MSSKSRSETIKWMLLQVFHRSGDAATNLRDQLMQQLQSIDGDFELAKSQLTTMEVHSSVRWHCNELLTVVPAAVESDDYIAVLVDIMDKQMIDLNACDKALSEFYLAIHSIWVLPVVAVTESPTVLNPEDETGEETPFEEAVEQASKAHEYDPNVMTNAEKKHQAHPAEAP